jgi:NADH:ubiquinone oxidoreductase subunit K
MKVGVLLRRILGVVLILLSLPFWLATLSFGLTMIQNSNAASYLFGPFLLVIVTASALLGLGMLSFPKESSNQTEKNSQLS